VKPCVLFVDEDQSALNTYARLVRNMVDVRAVTTAAAAIAALKEPTVFAAIVAEELLPDGNGTAVLSSAAADAPETARIMLTSVSEPRVVIEAVNSAGVFRFLTKPCKPETFIRAIGDALGQHMRLRRARELREQVGDGVVEMLAGFHTGTEPTLSERDAQLRTRAREVAQAMKLPFTADLDIGALLMRLGIATIPKHVRDKLHSGERLEPSETDLIDRIPEVVAHLLAHNPRLQGVVEILRHEAKVLVQDPDAPRAATRKDVPLAARILRALFDIHVLEEFGVSTSAALVRVRQAVGRYDNDVLKTIEHLYADPNAMAAAQMQELTVVDLIAGMVLAADALSHEGVPLVSKGTVLTPTHVEHLRLYADLGEVAEPIYVIRRDEPPATADVSAGSKPASV
jgi:response regulator RpfG family c-di-GMP phosphodiesterase